MIDMDCPRCKEPVQDGKCPRCGIVWDPEEAEPPEVASAEESGSPAHTEEKDKPGAGLTVGMEMLPGSPASVASQRTADWREELRRRLDRHGVQNEAVSLKAEETTPPSVPSQTDATSSGEPVQTQPKQPKQPPAPSIFQYKLKQGATSRPPLQNPVLPKQEPKRPDSVPTQVGAQAAAGKSPDSTGLRQPKRDRPERLTRLPLEVESEARPARPLADSAAGRTRQAVEPSAAGKMPAIVPAEILFSRFLSGIIDLTIPAVVAILLGLLATRYTDTDVFAGSTWTWMLILAVTLHLFTSFFFLNLVSQTPGMYAAQLKLVAWPDSDDIPAANIGLRVLLFPMVLVTVVGLASALFDKRRRCLHDLVSRTWVIALPSRH